MRMAGIQFSSSCLQERTKVVGHAFNWFHPQRIWRTECIPHWVFKKHLVERRLLVIFRTISPFPIEGTLLRLLSTQLGMPQSIHTVMQQECLNLLVSCSAARLPRRISSNVYKQSILQFVSASPF